MCCPVKVPHNSGGFAPAGLEMVRVSSAQLPLVSCVAVEAVVEAAVISNSSKSILRAQTSDPEGQMV